MAVAGGKSPAGVVEADLDSGTGYPVPSEQWPGFHEIFLSVGIREGPQRQPSPNLGFAGRVDVLHVADVIGDGHAGVRDFERLLLGPPDAGEVVSGSLPVVVGGELDEKKWRLGRLELLAPAGDEGFFLGGVGHALAVVRLALIPEKPTQRVGNERVNHRLVGAGFRIVAQAHELGCRGDGGGGETRVQGFSRCCGPVADGPDITTEWLVILGESRAPREPTGAGFRQFRDAGQPFLRPPRLDAGAAPRAVDHADGDLQNSSASCLSKK